MCTFISVSNKKVIYWLNQSIKHEYVFQRGTVCLLLRSQTSRSWCEFGRKGRWEIDFSCRANQFVTSHLHFALAFFRNESAENQTHEEWGVGSVFSMCNIQNSIDKLFKTSVPFFQIYSKLSFQMYSKF